MVRPGFVLEVDEKTPPLLRLAAADVALTRFPLGTHVLYPPDAVASSNPVPLIDAALENPVDGGRLALGPDKKVTIVISADEAVQPRMRFDVRRTIVERTLELAARAGVDDIEIVIASGLRRGWTTEEIVENLGARVATSFLPDGLITNHDVTGTDLILAGEVRGVPVRLNARVAESDLVIVVGVTTGRSRPLPIAVGLTDVTTIDRIRGFEANPDLATEIAEVVCAGRDFFAVNAVLGQPHMGQSLSFLNRREWEWRLPEQTAYAGKRQLMAALPRRGAQRLFGNPAADYAVIDVIGGELRRVYVEAAQVWQAANSIRVASQADILLTSAWAPEFEQGNPIGTPTSAAHHVLVERAGSFVHRPLLRERGVLIAFHPLSARFPQRAQAAAADFFATVIPETLDARDIHEHHEPRAVGDEWYLDLYRQNFADHPLQVFHSWYRICASSASLSEVIWVGGDRHNAGLLGHRAASTMADALEIASDTVGTSPTMTYLRSPGRVVGHVT